MSKYSRWSFLGEHVHFVVLLVLIVGVASYAIVSFFLSTDDYLDRNQASVLTAEVEEDAVSLVESSSDLEVPPECATCPPFPICSTVCPKDTGESAGEAYPIFTDVSSTDPYGKSIEALLYQGIVKGYDDGTFKPEKAINRAELLKIITNAVDADFAGSNYSNCFLDVKEQWFAPYICYAESVGWVNGYENNTYRPDNTVIRAEALKIVLVSLGFQVPTSVSSTAFKDVPVSAWYAPYSDVAVKQGIVKGGGMFVFDHPMTRGEFSEMVYLGMKAKGLLK